LPTLIYIRISTSDQKTDRQEAELTAWANRTGAANTEVLKEAISDSVEYEKREIGKRLQRGGVSRLVVLSLDQLGT
jgi:DNA invertase Pin-like site-specific DNA recombinase